jgi:carbon starvation protein
MNTFFWSLVAVVGAIAFGGVALQRGEPINALWIIVAAVCIYALGYRFYSAWVAARVLTLDATRATPAERLDNGRDFVPTNKWIVFGHHFAAIAGPGPLIGPTLAVQFGSARRAGFWWVRCHGLYSGHDVLLLSVRRNGRSLGQMARMNSGPLVVAPR